MIPPATHPPMPPIPTQMVPKANNSYDPFT